MSIVTKTFGLSPDRRRHCRRADDRASRGDFVGDLPAKPEEPVSVSLKAVAVTFLTSTLKALEATETSPPPVLTGSHFGALAQFLALIPISDLISLANGSATIDTAADLAEAGAEIVARAFPPVAITAEEVKLGLEALRFLLDAAGLGPTPFKITPGQNPIRGGWEGARGHI